MHVRKILHVLSYAKPIGGDSRFVWRWIQEDSNNRHFVAVTSQSDVQDRFDVPDLLRQSADKSGGYLKILGAPTSKPIEQARELRLLCQDMDIVVLHVFPYDVVPVLALAAGCESVKTIYINHSDHTFWIGASVAHSVAHLRTQPPHFLTKRRGLIANPSPLLPIPLFHSRPLTTSGEAKRALGYHPGTILLLTIASQFKYSSPGRITFLDLVAPVLARCPQAVLLAVGPNSKGAWRSASAETNGRIQALGTRWDNNLLYAATDVYLGSVPFSSITSLLEAGSYGIPLLGYGVPDGDLALLTAGAPGLDNAMMLATEPESYQALLTRLITDAAFRDQSGERIQTQISSLHTGAYWAKAVNELYSVTERNNERGCLLADNQQFQVSALDVALSQLYPRVHVSKLVAHALRTLPYASRLSLTWQIYRRGFDLCSVNVLPRSAQVISAQWCALYEGSRVAAR